jgi:hypothetical protein
MKFFVSAAALGLSALMLSGCGSAMRDYLERDTPQQQAAVRQDLTMPPDLRLPPPGTTQPAPDPGAPSVYDSSAGSAAATASIAPAAPRPAPEQGIYEKAGISLYKADGTKKSDAELRAELRAYYIAQKKQQNPSYGTVFNMGNIFSDD